MLSRRSPNLDLTSKGDVEEAVGFEVEVQGRDWAGDRNLRVINIQMAVKARRLSGITSF